MTIRNITRPSDEQNVRTQNGQASNQESVGQSVTQAQTDSRFVEVFKTRWKLNEAGYRFLADR